jgi:hypothetical protein
MIDEIDLFGVYMPAALCWALLAAALTALLRPLLRLPWLRKVVWQPGQIDLACFLCLWWALSVLADHVLPHTTVLS